MITNYLPFKNQKTSNLETFHWNVRGARTPVWFVQDDDVFHVRTGANSGRAKRVRYQMQGNIAPSKMDGTILDEWFPAITRELNDERINNRVVQLLYKKYGLFFLFLTAGRT